jgi:SAM-dependent methyltransferase
MKPFEVFYAFARKPDHIEGRRRRYSLRKGSSMSCNSLTTSAEFPSEMAELLRCSADGESFDILEPEYSASGNILNARLRCQKCDGEYRILHGIARLLPTALPEEDAHEMGIRNEEYSEASEYSPCSRSPLSDFTELPPFLRELEIDDRSIVLEVGCGDGRFTLLMCQKGARILAMDLSLNALMKLNERLETGKAPTPFPQDENRMRNFRKDVALIHCDASKVRFTPQSVNRVLSTTPLDTREQRLALYSTIADALTDDGWFIGSVENDDLFRRSLGLPLARRYEQGAIFIEHFDVDKVRREVGPFFKKLRSWPIRPRIPFLHRAPVGLGLRLANATSRIPVLRETGEILLFRASSPVRADTINAYRNGSFLAKRIFRWYAKLARKPAVWDGQQIQI